MNPEVLSTALPIAWLVLSIVGASLAVYSLIESTADFLSTRPTNGFRVLAVGDIVSESLRLVAYGAFALLGVGIIADAERVVQPTGTVLTLIGGLLLLISMSVVQLVVRRYLKQTHNKITPPTPETQDQREDRQFGQERRALEDKHREEDNL